MEQSQVWKLDSFLTLFSPTSSTFKARILFWLLNEHYCSRHLILFAWIISLTFLSLTLSTCAKTKLNFPGYPACDPCFPVFKAF